MYDTKTAPICSVNTELAHMLYESRARIEKTAKDTACAGPQQLG